MIDIAALRVIHVVLIAGILFSMAVAAATSFLLSSRLRTKHAAICSKIGNQTILDSSLKSRFAKARFLILGDGYKKLDDPILNRRVLCARLSLAMFLILWVSQMFVDY